MSRHSLAFVLALGAVGLLASAAWGQANNAAGLADPLDNQQGSARDLGMGSAFVGLADDASALFFNSAGLSSVGKPQVSLHHNSYLAGTFEETLLAAFPTGASSALAFSVHYVNWGSLDLRDNFGAPQGGFNDSDVGLMVGWGREWAPGFSAGAALRGLQQKVVDNLYNSLAADLGLLFSPAPGLRVGISYLNLGTPVGGDSLSQELRAGGSFFTALSPQASLTLALAGSWIPRGPGTLEAGLEGVLDGRWALRVGAQVPLADDQIGGFTDFTAGAGVKFSNLSIDYAYLPFGDLGTSHRISVGYQFDLPTQTVTVPVTVIQAAPQPSPASQDLQVEFKLKGQDPLAEGREWEKEGKDARAAQSYAQALQADPRDDRLWSALGHLYYRLGKKDYAIQCFEKVLQLEPSNQALRDWLIQYKGRPANP